MNFLAQIHPIVLLLISLVFTWSATSLGASIVFFFKDQKVNKRPLDITFGVSAGIMFGASIWSLIIPATELAEELWQNNWLSTGLGLLTGCLFITLTSLILDKVLPKVNEKKRSILLVGTITLHNIPEGLAVGVGFSCFALGLNGCTLLTAIMIALGIGIQNFPDGLAVSLPLYRDGMSKRKAFFIGQASGLVEPFSALLGYFITLAIRSMLPFLLTFAGGAMMTVVISELIPDINQENRNLSTLGFGIGFIAIMVLSSVLQA